jgi:hypothetical protein
MWPPPSCPQFLPGEFSNAGGRSAWDLQQGGIFKGVKFKGSKIYR